MGETLAAGYTDLCIVTPVGVEFKIATGLLTDKSFSEEPSSLKRRSETMKKCGAGFQPAPAACRGQVGNLPHTFSEESFTSSMSSPGNDKNSWDKTPSCPTFSEKPRMKICRGLFGARRITVLQSEMGAVGFAERLAKHLTDNRYDALIVVGLAGGLDPNLRIGDAVLYDLCYDTRALDFTRRERPKHEEIGSMAGDRTLSAFLFEALSRSGHFSDRASVRTVVQAPGITVSRIITEAKEKLALHVNYGAAAVDMETYEVFAACARLALPAAALRVISDEAGHNLPDFNRAYDADGRMLGWRMVATMIARPFVTIRLLLAIRRALQSLRANLRAAMSA
jgi:nucleoside phosphorylase